MKREVIAKRPVTLKTFGVTLMTGESIIVEKMTDSQKREIDRSDKVGLIKVKKVRKSKKKPKKKSTKPKDEQKKGKLTKSELNDMNKDDVIKVAEEQGIEVKSKDLKADIIDKILKK